MGHDFRPDYRKLKAAARRPSGCAPAGADRDRRRRTRDDILAQLGIPDDGLIIAGFDRPNIRYHVRHREQTGKQLRELLATQPGPAIVYAPSRDKAEKIAEQIARDGRPAAALSCRTRAAGTRAQPGGVRQFRGDGDRRDRRVRHGHRQARRPARRACRDPQEHRGLLPGDRPRRARRRARPRPGCSGPRRISPAPASGSSRRSSPTAARPNASG